MWVPFFHLLIFPCSTCFSQCISIKSMLFYYNCFRSQIWLRRLSDIRISCLYPQNSHLSLFSRSESVNWSCARWVHPIPRVRAKLPHALPTTSHEPPLIRNVNNCCFRYTYACLFHYTIHDTNQIMQMFQYMNVGDVGHKNMKWRKIWNEGKVMKLRLI